MDDLLANDDEQRAIDCFLQSQPAVYGGLIFRAEIIRLLMLGHAIPGMGKVLLPGTGLRLIGATIQGSINLEFGCLPDGKSLPPLALEECYIEEPIILTSARLRRLSLKGSRISVVEADHIHISGQLDIVGVHPYPSGERKGAGINPQDICRIGMRGAHIEDGIEAAHAHLVGPRISDSYEIYAKRSAYALDLPEAQINGDVRLFPDFVACGGVNINGATINGSFQAHGAEFTSEQMYALDASGAHIHGSLSLDTRNTSMDEFAENGFLEGKPRRFFARGQIQLHNISVVEDLRLNGAKIIDSHISGGRILGDKGCISAEHMTVGGDASFCAYSDEKAEKYVRDDGKPAYRPCLVPFECQSRLDLRGAQISGDLNMRGAELFAELDVSAGKIGGHAYFGPHDLHEFYDNVKPLRADRVICKLISNGDIWLDGMAVKGDLDFRGAWLRKALKARGMDVGGSVRFSPYEACYFKDGKVDDIWRFHADGNIFLDTSNVGLSLDMSGAFLTGELIAPSLKVGGKLLMCAYVPDDESNIVIWFDAKKRVNLSGATIRSDFDLTGAKLEEGLRFRGGNVDSALIIDIFRTEKFDGDPENKKSIDLHNARVNILDDNGCKRGRKLGYDKNYYLRLEGFTYGRFPHYADNESLNREEENRRQSLKGAIRDYFEARKSWWSKLKDFTKYRLLWLWYRENFEISPKSWVKLRLKWLKKQFRGKDGNIWTWLPDRFFDIYANLTKKSKPRWWFWIRSILSPRRVTSRNYNPDPYNTLYKYYKRMGAQSQADEVLRTKLTIERKTGSLRTRVALKFFDLLFGWGLSPIRATLCYLLLLISLKAILAAGDAGQEIALPSVAEATHSICHGMARLWSDTQVFSTNLATNPFGVAADLMHRTTACATMIWQTLSHIATTLYNTRPAAIRIPGLAVASNSCGNETSLRELVQALELAIPPVHLNGQDACDIPVNVSVQWQAFKVGVTLLGWIMASLTALTWTGLFRRNVEP